MYILKHEGGDYDAWYSRAIAVGEDPEALKVRAQADMAEEMGPTHELAWRGGLEPETNRYGTVFTPGLTATTDPEGASFEYEYLIDPIEVV